jgi:hypothetical protein
MKNNMKLIMERWDRFVITEQAVPAPQTVGELIDAVNSYTMIKGDKTKRIISSIVSALNKFSSIEGMQDNQQLGSLIQKTIEVLNVFLQERDIKSALAKVATGEVFQLVYDTVTSEPIASYLAKTIGEAIVKTFIEEIIPGLKTIVKVGSFFSSLFSIAKDVQKAVETGKMDPNQVLQLIAKEIYELPDSKETTTGFMKIFNVDDKWSAIIDDKIEMKFIELAMNSLRSMNPSTPLESISFNKMLVDYLKNTYSQRTLTGPSIPTT